MSQMTITPNKTSKYQRSIQDFRNARQKAAMESVVSRLTGKSTELLSFDEVASKLKVLNHAERGIQDIPVEAIVGSVGRYTDFSRSFLPMQESDADRWARVASVSNFHQLPPIEVYQIGDVYFVLDGNHRVSIARQRGMLSIPAQITEVRTRVPIPANVDSDKLILQAEYVQFLENTQLDKLRPNAQIEVSIPGQFCKLEDHIQVHRFFIEQAEEKKLSDQEAITRWYDDAYLPVVESVREQGVLRDFPNRTETDLYLWISEHQTQIQEELGWQVSPEVATANLANRFEPETDSRAARLGKKVGRSILNIVVPKGGTSSPSWSQTKRVARYSDRLFADLLVVFLEELDYQGIVAQALDIASKENARLHGLCPEVEQSKHGTASLVTPEMKSWFAEQCRKAGLEGRLAAQVGNPIKTIYERAVLADMIIYGRPTQDAVSEAEANQQLISLIRQSPRPVFIPTAKPVSLDNILLAYDGCAKSNEALFVAAYMAERWGSTLTVGLAPEDRFDEDETIKYAQNYLEMHEVEADYVVCELDPIQLVMDTAASKDAELIIAGGYSERRFGRRGPGNIVNQLVTEWSGALLICP